MAKGVTTKTGVINVQTPPSLSTSSSSGINYALGPVTGNNGSYASTSLDGLWGNLVNGVPGRASPLPMSEIANIVSSLAGKVVSPANAKSELSKLFSQYVPGPNSNLAQAIANQGGASGSGGSSGGSSGGASALQIKQDNAQSTIDGYLSAWGLSNMSGWAYNQVVAEGNTVSTASIVDALRQTPQYAAVYPGNAELLAAGKAIIPEQQYKTLQTQYVDIAATFGLDTSYFSTANVGDLIGKFGTQSPIDAIRTTPTYAQAFPGNVTLMGEGKAPIPESTYMNITQGYKDAGNQFGLPTDFLSNQEMGTLISGSVSVPEFTQRVQNGYAVAQTAPAETRNLLQQYYGVNTGDLAHYYLDPTKAWSNLQKQTQAAVIGTEATSTGFGNLNLQQAENLAQQQIASPGLDANYFRQGFSKAATLSPLEQAGVGTRGQTTVSQQQLIDYAFPGSNAQGGTNAASEDAALKLATEARSAGLSGGGGYAQTAKGAVGVGRAGSQGTSGT